MTYIEALTPEELTSSTVLNIDFNIIEPEDYPDYATRTGLCAFKSKYIVFFKLKSSMKPIS
jgi:hypothetical protein